MPVRLLRTCLFSESAVVLHRPGHGWPDGRWAFPTEASADSQRAGAIDTAKPLGQARTAVETLIDRLRGDEMPEGIVKTNGRIEATQVDVSAKYAGRLAKLTVNEGDEVTAGQVVARISSPEYEAQLRAAQAQVLKAKQALAEAEALIAQRKSDLIFARTDFERGKELVAEGISSASRSSISGATRSMRPRPRYVCRHRRSAIRPSSRSRPPRPMSSGSRRSWSISCSSRRAAGACNTGSPAPARWSRPAQRVLTILDLNDVYMTIYLPAAAGRQARARRRGAHHPRSRSRNTSFPATISFVATDAQFTPKSVETAEERAEADVPRQAPGRSQGAGQIPPAGEDGRARPRLRAHRSQRPLARRACGEASAMTQRRSVARLERRHAPLRQDDRARRRSRSTSRPAA